MNSTHDEWTKEYVSKMFAKAGLDRNALSKISKDRIPLGIDSLIYPIRLPPVVSDVSLKTGMSIIIIVFLWYQLVTFYSINWYAGILDIATKDIAAQIKPFSSGTCS